MKKRMVLIAAILLLAVPLIFLLRDVARQVFLIRILRTVWNVRVLFESLPQTWLWTILVTVALLIAAKSLMGRGMPDLPPEEVGEEQLGRVATVTRQIQRSWESDYSRRSLARDVRALALEVLAHQRRSTSEDPWLELRNGRLEAPAEILDYLNVERWRTHSQATHFLARLRRRLFGRARAPRPDAELERVVEFLEAELEGRAWTGERTEMGGIE